MAGHSFDLLVEKNGISMQAERIFQNKTPEENKEGNKTVVFVSSVKCGHDWRKGKLGLVHNMEKEQSCWNFVELSNVSCRSAM